MKRFSLCALVVMFLTVVTFAIQGAYAQANFGSINGTVTDPTGAAVPGATVVVTNNATGVAKTLTTNPDGFYSAQGLSAGAYTVKISAANFQTIVFSNVQLTPGQILAQNAKLTISSVSSQVTVSANTLQVNTQTAASGGTISSQQISNLMLNGRNFQTLAISIPGVNSTAAANSLSGGGLLGGTTLIVNGQSVENTTYTIDGVYNMNSGNLANINILPIVDAIAQFSVLKANYSAKYGFAGAGQIVVQTKEGGQSFHGDAWDFLRNDALDANNYFSTSKQSLHQNIFGYTLGGPVILPRIFDGRKHKTFFFASNQWYVINAGQVNRGSVLPQAMRNGDFSQSPTLPKSGVLTLSPRSEALLASTGRTNCLTGPTTINPSCISPVAAALLKQYQPLPNNPSGGFLNYINQNPQTTSQVDYQYRIDQQLGSNQLTGRVMYEQVKNGFPRDQWGGHPYSTYTDSFYTTAFNGLIRLQSTITPNLVNTASVAETYDKPRINLTTGHGTMPSGVTIKQAFPDAPTLNRMPDVSISEGWSGFGVGTQPITASDGEGILQDDVSWVHGKQILQGGLFYMFGIKRQNVFTTPQGSFTFTGIHTGDPAADFLLGLNSTYSQASSQKLGSYHYRQGAWYVQDDYHVLPRLTLNLGMRWVYFSSDTVSGDQVTGFNPALYDPAQAPVVNIDGSFNVNSQNQPLTADGKVANVLNGLAFAGKNGVPSGFFIPSKNNWGPRVGFAWDLFGNGKTSLRGGYGIGYNRVPLEQIYDAFGQNPPFNLSANILNSLLDDGTAGGVAAAPTPQTLASAPLKFSPTQMQSFSLTLEQQVLPNMVADVAYVGNVGRHLMSFQGGYDANFPLPVSAPSTTGCLAPGQAPSSRYDFDPCINTGAASANFTRPFKGYAAMNDQYDKGSSNYNSLQTSLRYRVSNLQFSLAYTYAKALATIGAHGAGGTTSQGVAAQNMRNFHAEYGPPSYDFTHSIAATWVYNIPFNGSNPVLRGALRDWMISGLALHQSGFAMSPGMSTSTNGLAIRPNAVAKYSKVGKLDEWFDTSAFAAPAFGFFGNASNGTIRGPGYTSFNVALARTFPILERLHGQFRAEAFNLANHPSFENVSTGLGSGTYGHVTSAGDPRILEFAFKLIY